MIISHGGIWMKKVIIAFISTLLISSSISMNIYAKDENKMIEDDLYHIVNLDKNGNIEELTSEHNYEDARLAFDNVKDTSNNAAIYYKNKYVEMEYGVVKIKSVDDCSYNVSYTNVDNGEAGYTNGCYGGDGAYRSTSEDGSEVEFRLSNVNARASSDDVELIPYDKSSQFSLYEIKNREMVHHIKTNWETIGYANSVILGEAPSYLKEKEQYYSYDGQYFYAKKDFKKMCDDYRDKVFTNALNVDRPFFNYYQYLPHRSLSSYNEEDLNKYLKEYLGVNKNISNYIDRDLNGIHDGYTQSLFDGTSSAFLQYQSEYGANALMMIALARNESANGRSVLAYTKNNLFGHAAYDSSAAQSASRYLNSGESIQSHAKYYISDSYANPEKFMYHGSFFGDKQSGMNVSYASDPYWGEKATQYTYQIDKRLGNKDKNLYTLGIKTSFNPIEIYAKADNKSKVLYEIENIGDYSFILLKKVEKDNQTYYQVQCDPVINKNESDENLYNFNKNTGYILASDIQVILNKEQLENKITYENITFDANKGLFNFDKSKITIQVKSGSIPSITPPMKENYEFAGWDSELKRADKNTTYKAKWKKVDKIEWVKKPKTTYQKSDKLDLRDGKINISYQDGTHKEVPLSIDMVKTYDLETVGEDKWIIETAGKTLPLKVKIKKETGNDQRSKLKNELNEALSLLQGKSSYSKDEVKILKNVNRVFNQEDLPYLAFHEIRSFDQVFKNANDMIKVEVDQDETGVSFSGLRLLVDHKKAWDDQEDKVVASIKSNVDGEQKITLKKIAKINGRSVDQYLSLHVDIDGEEQTNFNSPVVVSIPKPKDFKEDDLYQVMLEVNDEIYMVETTQSDSLIKFKAPGSGCYAITHMSYPGLGYSEDIIENDYWVEEKDNSIYGIWIAIGLPVSLLAVLTVYYYAGKRGKKKKHELK